MTGIAVTVIVHLRPSFYTHSVPSSPADFPNACVFLLLLLFWFFLVVVVVLLILFLLTISNSNFYDSSDIVLPYLLVVC